MSWGHMSNQNTWHCTEKLFRILNDHFLHFIRPGTVDKVYRVQGVHKGQVPQQHSTVLSPGCRRSRWTATLRSRFSRSFSSFVRRISLWYSATVSLTARKISCAAAVSLSFRNTFSSSSLVMFSTAEVSRGGTSFCLHPQTRKMKKGTGCCVMTYRRVFCIYCHLLGGKTGGTAEQRHFCFIIKSQNWAKMYIFNTWTSAMGERNWWSASCSSSNCLGFC